MKKIVHSLLCALTLSALVFAQNGSNPSPAQTKLAGLNAEVVKLYQAGKLSEALTLAEKLRQRSETLLGANDPQTILAWLNVGEIQLGLKKFKEAGVSFRQALKLQELKSGPETALVSTLTRLAFAVYNDGKNDEAEKILTRALAICEKNSPANDAQTAEVVELMGQFYAFTNRLDKAATLYRRAYEIKANQTPPYKDMFLLQLRYDCALIKLKRQSERAELQQKVGQLRAKSGSSVTLVENVGILNGKALEVARPEYPLEAKRAKASGTVSVQMYIDEQGEIVHVCAISGHELLQQTAENAAYRSRFPPTRLNGKAVKVTGILNYNFVPQ